MKGVLVSLLCCCLLCAAAPARADADADELLRAVARFRAGAFKEAEPLLGALHARAPADADVTLLLGIVRYRLHRLDDAEALLRAAALSADAETAASARIFLGLVSDERGDVDAVRQYLLKAARTVSATLGGTGDDLLHRLSPRIVTLLFLLRPEFDSNVPLLPGAATASTASGQRADGDVLALFSLSLRPIRAVGFTIDETASYRQQFTLLDYDLFINTVGVGYAYLGRDDRVSVGYTFEVATLGRSLLDLAHGVGAAYRRRLVRELGLGVQYAFKYRDYYASDYQPFSGPSHAGAVEASWGTADRPLEIAAGYLVLRDDTVDPTFSATAHGGRLRLRARLARIVELTVTGWAVRRIFDVPDPAVGPRHDTQIYADASLGIDLTHRVGLILGGAMIRNISTVADFDYWKLTAHLGLAVGYTGP